MSKAKETSGEQAGRNKKGQFTKGNKIGPRFEPGESANPNGRRNSISDILRQMLDEDEGAMRKELAAKLMDRAKKASGNEFYMALDRIQDRTEGKPTQPTADVSDTWQKFLEGVFEPQDLEEE